MKQLISIFMAGLLFGAGLAISEMVNPARVIGFLDIAGHWDITLLLVMSAALLVAMPGFQLMRRLSRPLFSEHFNLPATRNIDSSLVTGSVLFGIGWGMAGLCPGPAIASMVTGYLPVFYFVFAMVCGQLLARLISRFVS